MPDLLTNFIGLNVTSNSYGNYYTGGMPKVHKRLSGLLSLQDAADFLNVDCFTVQRWVWAKDLRARRRGRRWLIFASEVKRKMKERSEGHDETGT